jgi:hypothetical protein
MDEENKYCTNHVDVLVFRLVKTGNSILSLSLTIKTGAVTRIVLFSWTKKRLRFKTTKYRLTYRLFSIGKNAEVHLLRDCKTPQGRKLLLLFSEQIKGMTLQFFFHRCF